MPDASGRCNVRRLMRRLSCSSAAWTAARARPTRAAHPPLPAPRATAPPCGPVAAPDWVTDAQHGCNSAAALLQADPCQPLCASPCSCKSRLPVCECVLCPLAMCGTAPSWLSRQHVAFALPQVIEMIWGSNVDAQQNAWECRGCMPRQGAQTPPEPESQSPTCNLGFRACGGTKHGLPVARAHLELLKGRPLVGVARPALAHDCRQRRRAAGRDDRPQALLHHAYGRLRQARTIKDTGQLSLWPKTSV